VSGQTICRLAEEAAEAPDPESALETLTALRRELDEFERQQVARALTAGRSFGAIAKAMGVTRQAVHRRFRDLSKRRRVSGMAPSPEVRLAVEYAGAEAKALGARTLAPAHVVLGILRTGDRRAAASLTAAGVTLEECRKALGPASPGDRQDGGLRALLGDAVQAAKGRGHERIEAEHLLRAALAGRHAPVGGMLQQIGVAAERVLDALDAMPADDADCPET
jgi:ATP-dependent Clp protease ATP-binding subunit ClpA